MKTSKKILGVALALIMIFNVFAIGTFAAGTESAVDLWITADKDVYSAGDEVVFTISAQAISAVGDLRIGGGYAIGYNTAVIQPYSTGVDLDDHAVTALQDGYDSTISTTVDKSMDSLDEDGAAAYGWNDWIIYGLADDGFTSFSATERTDLFTFKMKIADDAADGEYVIGFNKASYVSYNAYINDNIMGGIYGYDDDYGYGTTANYGFNNVTIKVGAAAADPEVTHAKTMGQMADWTDTTATTFNAGFVGKISNLDVEFDANDDECTTIESIVVEITRGDVTLTGNAYQLYAQADGSYLFRAVVKNAAISDTEAISYKYIVTLADGSELTYESTEDTSFNAIYNTAKANYDAANA